LRQLPKVEDCQTTGTDKNRGLTPTSFAPIAESGDFRTTGTDKNRWADAHFGLRQFAESGRLHIIGLKVWPGTAENPRVDVTASSSLNAMAANRQ